MAPFDPPLSLRSAARRFLLGLVMGTAGALLSTAVSSSQALVQLGFRAVGVVGAAVLFGPAALLGAVGGLGLTRALTHPFLDTAMWLLYGIIVYAGFRLIPGIGRGLPNLKSYFALLASVAVASVVAGAISPLGRFPSAYLLAAWIWGVGRATGLVILLPPLFLLVDRIGRSWLAPIPGEVLRPALPPPTTFFGDTSVDPTTPAGTLDSWRPDRHVALVALTILALATLAVPAREMGPWSWSWLGLLYVVPVLWSAVRFGLRGGVLSASASGLAFLIGTTVLAGLPPSRATHEQNLAVASYIVLLSVIGAVIGAFQDRQVALRTQLVDSDERFRLLCDSTLEGIAITEQGWVLDANEQLCHLLGVDRDELIGAEISSFVAPESRPLVESQIQDKPEVRYEHLAMKKDGTAFPVEVHARTVPFQERVVRVTAIRDVSAWKEAQAALEESQEQLRQAQRLEAIGRLAGGVAHDFNNLLTVIGGYNQIILEMLSPNDPRWQPAKEIEKASERASSLVRQLLAFSRKQILEPRLLDLNQVVSETQRMLQRLIGEDIELVTSLEPELGLVEIDPGQLEQVILNIAVNARDAMPKGGRFTIETWNTQLDERGLEGLGSLPVGSYVGLSLSDNGTGMDSQTRDRVFEPFFTTKEKDKGTGLGLATVYGIVTQSGGAIGVSSQPGRGTTFRIYLPRAQGSVDVPATPVSTT